MSEELKKNQGYPPFMVSSIIAFIVTVLIIVYIIVAGMLKVHDFWFGIIFLWYLGTLNSPTNKEILASVLGGCVGTAVAYGLALGNQNLFVLIGFAIVLVLLISLNISHKIPLLVNNSTMLMLTIFTFKDVANPTRIRSGLVGYFAGIVFFGSVFIIINILQSRKVNSQ